MKPIGYIAIVAVLSALAFFPFYHLADGAQRKSSAADTQMRTKGRENPNTQWFADPDRGWVRSEEQRESLPRKDTVKENNKKKRADKIDGRKVINY